MEVLKLKVKHSSGCMSAESVVEISLPCIVRELFMYKGKGLIEEIEFLGVEEKKIIISSTELLLKDMEDVVVEDK